MGFLSSILMDKKVSIDRKKCVNCSLCARVCPMQLSPYTDYDDRCQLKSNDCIRCGACIVNCPVRALSFEPNRIMTGEPCPGKMKRGEYKAVIVKVEDLTPTVREFTFRLEENTCVSFEPGQFMLIKVLDGPFVFRAYSISSTPERCKEVRLAIKRFSDGQGSPILDEFKEGTEALLEGPMGEFTLKADTKKFVFGANGIGITPFVSMTYEALKRKKSKVILLFGIRDESEIMYEEYFKDLEKNNDNFQYLLSLSRPSEAWQGRKGPVTDIIQDLSLEGYDAYLCGSKPMLRDTKKVLINSGVKPDRIFYESFF